MDGMVQRPKRVDQKHYKGVNMSFEAKIIADSLSPMGVRLTTMQLKYPRFIHAEFMTHRVFSRNASSSRAIPLNRIIAAIEEDPAMPIYWGLNQKGMQARKELEGEAILDVQADWLEARDMMIAIAKDMSERYNLHKQLVNRLLEPWSHIYVVVTATEWENFFNLRIHPDAQPEIKRLAETMKLALDESRPNLVNYDEWHLPYVLTEERSLETHNQLKISTARCARVSYKTHDGFTPRLEEDILLHDDLLGNGHMSPLEHAATPIESSAQFVGNFRGWSQYRKGIPGEDVFRPLV